MVNVKKHLSILGKKVECKVTNFKGVATSVGFDLYGCVQIIVNPGIDATGKPGDSHWFDIGRLNIVDDTPVMSVPDFEFGPAAEGRKGPAEKPATLKV